MQGTCSTGHLHEQLLLAIQVGAADEDVWSVTAAGLLLPALSQTRCRSSSGTLIKRLQLHLLCHRLVFISQQQACSLAVFLQLPVP